MTTREWFRLWRGSLWERDTRYLIDVAQVADAISAEELPIQWTCIGPLMYVADPEAWERRECLLQQLREDMNRAMRRLARKELLKAARAGSDILA